MSDLNITDLFLYGVITYGPLVLGVALLLGALGTPLPGTLLVLAAGAFVRQGVIDWKSALILGLSGAVLGDSLSYTMGRFAKASTQQRFGQSIAWLTAQNNFKKHGSLAIYLTRFLLTPLAVPTNLVAGGSGYVFWRFLTYDMLGELTWITLFGGLGYTFGSQWELISQQVNDFSDFLVGAIALGVGIVFLIRRQGRTFSQFPAQYWLL